MDSPSNITIRNKTASAVISLFGATVLSYIVHDKQVLFVSASAILDGTKPIRGGIPLIFPQFGAGDGKLPSHGFARTSTWRVVRIDFPNRAVLALEGARGSIPAWPNAYSLEYTVEITDDLALLTTLKIENPGEESFEFQALQHTYFDVPDATKLAVWGMGGKSYVNQLAKGAVEKLSGPSIKIAAEVDWIFLGEEDKTFEDAVIRFESGGGVTCRRSFTCGGSSRPCDVVVWNPWIEKSKKMTDFGDEEFMRMICVEPGNVSRRDVLKPGETASLVQRLALL